MESNANIRISRHSAQEANIWPRRFIDVDNENSIGHRVRFVLKFASDFFAFSVFFALSVFFVFSDFVGSDGRVKFFATVGAEPIPKF